jgi:tripartite-type tricarboxylate transporter receptor subunit TctC
MNSKWAAALALLAVAGASPSNLIGKASAQDAVANFYRGKTVQMIVGSSAGGGYDLYGRLVARTIGKYLPGNPTVVTSNMAGAASIVATQHIAIAAPKDGTVIGAIFPGAIMEPLLGDKGKVKYDARKLSFIGSANNELYVCIVRADAGVKTFDEFLKGNILIGASAAGGSTRDFPLLLTSVLGANFKIVSGYPGSTEILLAIEKGEVQGTCGVGWSTISVQRGQWLRDGFIKVMAQEGMKSVAELDKIGVPLAYSYAKTPEQQQVMQLHYEPLTFGRPFIAAPEVPADRLEALRTAFMKALNDPDLRAEAERLKLDIAPTSGTEVAAIVNKIFDLPPSAIEAGRAAIGSK